MSRNFISIVPAQDWFFVHESHEPNKPTAHRVAVWALDSSGETTGLIGGVPTGPGTLCESNRLVGAPTVKGTYKHLSSLTEAELHSAMLKQ
jgi:hypothetical protein